MEKLKEQFDIDYEGDEGSLVEDLRPEPNWDEIKRQKMRFDAETSGMTFTDEQLKASLELSMRRAKERWENAMRAIEAWGAATPVAGKVDNAAEDQS